MSQSSKRGIDKLGREEVRSAYEELRPAYESALQVQYRGLRSLLEKEGYTPAIKYRVKHFEAYFKKLASKGGEVTDLLGLRIVCPFLEDVERIERILTDHFPVVETVRKGADHSFREFGYDSVHLLIGIDPGLLPSTLPEAARVCEIQLRTILQDAWAEVEHELIYKSDISLPNDSIKRKLASLNATLTLSDLIFQEIRDYQKEIRMQDRKRRRVMEEASTAIFPDGAGQEPLPPLSTSVGSVLEKAMLEALQAHGDGDLEEAVKLYSGILSMELSDAIRSLVLNHRGMARFALGDYAGAEKDFTGAISLDGENVRGYNNRGLTFRVLRRCDRSLEDYGRSIEIDPGQGEAYWGRAQTYYEMSLLTRALEDCEKLVRLQPDHAPARELLGCIRRELF